MQNSPKGICFISDSNQSHHQQGTINIIAELFKILQFTVIRNDNESNKPIFEVLNKISKSEDLVEHDAFICILISKGGKDFIEEDGKSTSIYEIINLFNDKSCVSLRGKPKIFFFNYFQGKIFNKPHFNSI